MARSIDFGEWIAKDRHAKHVETLLSQDFTNVTDDFQRKGKIIPSNRHSGKIPGETRLVQNRLTDLLMVRHGAAVRLVKA